MAMDPDTCPPSKAGHMGSHGTPFPVLLVPYKKWKRSYYEMWYRYFSHGTIFEMGRNRDPHLASFSTILFKLYFFN